MKYHTHQTGYNPPAMDTKLLAAMIKSAFAFILTILLLSLPANASDVSDLDGSQLMARYANTQTVDSELAYLELKSFETDTPAKDIIKKRFLTVTRKNGDGDYDYLVRIIEPLDVAGVSVLTNVKNSVAEQYLFLPAQGKALKLGPAGNSGSFLGSDFAYEDLVRESAGSFDYKRLPDAMAQGEACAVIEARPAEGNESQYAYRKIFLDTNSFEVRKIEFFREEGGKPVKELQA